MTARLVATIGAMLAAILVNAKAMGETLLMPPSVEQVIQERVNNGRYPAMVVALVDGPQSGLFTYGQLPDGASPTVDTAFEIGSITKTFTAVLLAEEVQSGRVHLEDPVATELPDFAIPQRNGRQITPGELAMQCSGLPRLPDNLRPANLANPYAGYDAGKLKSFLGRYMLTRDPGASYEYSNLGFALLGYALARSAHMSFASLLEQKILSPLGMRATTLTVTEAMRVHLAPGHDAEGNPASNWDQGVFASAGGIVSTPGDMQAYLKASMGLAASPLDGAIALAQQPRRNMDSHSRIGLAWMTTTTPNGSVVWHNGRTGGYGSFIGMSADRHRGVVILTNVSASVDDLGMALLLRVRADANQKRDDGN